MKWRTRAYFFLLTLGGVAISVFAQETETPSFEIEPPLLIKEVTEQSATPAGSPAPREDVHVLEKKLENAKRNSAFGERLFKMGAIAKVDAEQRALKVVRLQAEIENTRLAAAKEKVVELRPSDAVDLAQAEALAKLANENRERAEMEAAILNVKRQKKLLALGSGGKSAVNRAQEKLEALKQQGSATNSN
jgi:hypothetical protein